MPTLLAGLGTTGIVVVASGSSVAPVAAPTPAASVVGSAPQPIVREQGTSRSAGTAREAVSEAAQKRAAAAKAKAARAAKAKAQAAKASRAKAAKAAAQRAAAKARARAAAIAPRLIVVGTRYTRVSLNVRAGDSARSRLVTVLRSGSKVSITKTVRGGWRYISYRGAGGWVKNQYLVRSKPKAGVARPTGTSSRACAGGSRVERGLTPDAVRVHRAICARFPSVKAYGGVRADALPEHPSGRALDAMIGNRSTGWAIANYVRANARRLGVSQILFDRRIWTVQRGSEGWRSFADRGSPTANHQDHVHVSVYGRSGG